MTLTQITEKGIKDGEIVNADINASAAIAGSKISPAFGTNITTTGNAVIGGTTINTAQDKALSIFGTNGSELKLQATNFGGTAADGGAALTCTFGSLFLTNNNANGDIHFQTKVSGQSTSEKMRLTEAGRLLIGTTSVLHSQNNKLYVAGTDASTSISLNRYSNDANAPYIYFRKSRSGTIGGNTSVQDDDLLGRIYFAGNDGSSPVSAAYIEAHVDGTPGNQDMPGRLEFLTAADGSPTPVERMRINSSGQVGISTTSPQAKLNIQDTSNDGAISQLLKLGNDSSGAGTGAGLQLGAGSGNPGNSALLAGFYDGTGTSFTVSTCNTFNGAQSEKLRITNLGKVGIGNSSPSFMLDSRGGQENALRLGNTLETGHGSHNVKIAAGNSYYQDLKFTTSDVKFETYNGSALGERFRVRNNGGVTFNGDTADNNALDDYEEGTFTPTATFETSDSGNKTYSTQSGSYVKVGRLVHCNIVLVFNNRGTGSGRLRFNGLPFTVGDNLSGTSLEASATVGYFAGLMSSVSGIHPVAIQGTNQIVFYGILGQYGGDTGDFGYSHVSNSFSIRFSITYQV